MTIFLDGNSICTRIFRLLMNLFKDQLGRKVELKGAAQRVISLVPSQTELLYDLGLGDRVVGITKFCVHPKAWFQSKARVGGTKQLNMEAIHALKPDLIIANKEENDKSQVEALMAQYPVWVSDIKDLGSATDMINCLGELLEKKTEAIEMVSSIDTRFESIPFREMKNCAYLIWRKPYMCAGGDTYINNMLRYAGFDNAFAKWKRYPVIELEDLEKEKIAYILLSSEPYPFAEKHIEEIQAVCPDAKVILVDGEMFSWYGSRLLKVPAYFDKIRN